MKRRIQNAMSCVMLALLLSTGSGQLAAQPAARTGEVGGKVIDPAGQPIAGAVVL